MDELYVDELGSLDPESKTIKRTRQGYEPVYNPMNYPYPGEKRGFNIGQAFGVVLAVASLAVPGIGQVVGSSILSAVGITGASAAVTAGVGAAALSAASTAAAGGSVEDVLKNAASAGFASGVNISLGGGVTGAAAGSVAGTAIKGGDVDQVLTNALAAGVGAGVTGVIGPAAGTIATSLVATGGVSDQTLFNAAVAEINGFNKPGNASAQIVEATGVPTTSSEINTQMQRLNFQQDLRDQLMNDGAFQQVSMLPVVAAGAQIAAEVGIPAIIRAAPIIAEYMGANMAREQIAAAIADVAGHAAALWYLNNLNNDSYFGQRFIPETGQTVTVDLPPISEAEQSKLDKLYDQYQTTYAIIPTTEPNTLDTVVVILTKITPEQQAELANPSTAEAAAANVSATVTTVKPNGQTTTQPADTTSGVISVNNIVPVKSEASGSAERGGGGGGGDSGGGGGGGGGSTASGTPGAGPAGGETIGAGGTTAPGAGAGGDGGLAGSGAGTVTGARGGPGAGLGAGTLIGAGVGTTGDGAGAGVINVGGGDGGADNVVVSGGGGNAVGNLVVGGGGGNAVGNVIVSTGGGDNVGNVLVSGGDGNVVGNVSANVIVTGGGGNNVSNVIVTSSGANNLSNVVITDGGANNASNVFVTGGGANNVSNVLSNVVITGGGGNNVSDVSTRYPTITSVPPPGRSRQPIITGASPARLLADALAAYRPAGAIEGEETGKERQNVWNEKSLRLKDALGL
jgi:hypothetical protein